MGVAVPLKINSAGNVTQLRPGDTVDPVYLSPSFTSRAPASDVIIPASSCLLSSGDYEVTTGHVTEIGVDSVLEIT